jgi:hypothetical protein
MLVQVQENVDELGEVHWLMIQVSARPTARLTR